MTTNISGSGIVSWLLHSVIDSCHQGSYTDYHFLHNSFLTSSRLAWLRSMSLPLPRTIIIKKMRLYSCNKFSLIGNGYLGELVNHNEWMNLLVNYKREDKIFLPNIKNIITDVNNLPGNVKTYKYDLKKFAKFILIEHKFNHEGVCSQWFNNQGILARLPYFEDNQSLLILSACRNVDLNFFHRELMSEVYNYEIISSSDSYLIENIMHLPEHKNDYLLFGDARFRIHPMAGQGLNLNLFFIENLIKNKNDLSLHIYETRKVLQKFFILTKLLSNSRSYICLPAFFNLLNNYVFLQDVMEEIANHQILN